MGYTIRIQFVEDENHERMSRIGVIFFITVKFSASSYACNFYSMPTGAWSTTSHTGPTCSCTPTGAANETIIVNHDLCTSFPNPPSLPSGCTTLNTINQLHGDIVIKSGAKLYFNSGVTIHTTAQITIESGGELYLRGGIDNRGDIKIDGKLRLNGSLVNRAGGRIAGGGIFYYWGAITNSGTFCGGTTIATNNAMSNCVAIPNPVPCAPMPVDLIDFEVTDNQNHALLEWSTASTTNSDYFIVEKYNGLDHTEDLCKIYTSNNSNDVEFYNYSDYNHEDYSTTYYRLKQVDIDGTTTLFPFTKLRNDVTGKITFQPSSNTLSFHNLNQESHESELKVYTISGEVIQEEKFDYQPTAYKLNELKPGSYIIKYIDQSEQINTKIFMPNH